MEGFFFLSTVNGPPAHVSIHHWLMKRSEIREHRNYRERNSWKSKSKTTGGACGFVALAAYLT